MNKDNNQLFEYRKKYQNKWVALDKKLLKFYIVVKPLKTSLKK